MSTTPLDIPAVVVDGVGVEVIYGLITVSIFF